MLVSSSIKAKALELGFDLCGVAPAADHAELHYLREWLARGHAGEMSYLARTARRRADVRAVVPAARSAIVTGTVYNVDRPYSTDANDSREALVSRCAWGDDYHDVIGRRLDVLLEWMRAACGEPFEARAFVDTGPVQERVYAKHAGLGWSGKNTCLVNADLGSWFFLGVVICSLVLEPDAPVPEGCGACTLCLEACPTGALVEPGMLNASKCLSYLTAELKGSIPADLRDRMGSRVYGCDVCQDVCPWNGPAVARSSKIEWLPRTVFEHARLTGLWALSDSDLEECLKGSAMSRPGVRRFRRNLAVALGNSTDVAAVASLDDTRLNDGGRSTIEDPMVAEHVCWARQKLRSNRPSALHDGRIAGWRQTSV